MMIAEAPNLIYQPRSILRPPVSQEIRTNPAKIKLPSLDELRETRPNLKDEVAKAKYITSLFALATGLPEETFIKHHLNPALAWLNYRYWLMEGRTEQEIVRHENYMMFQTETGLRERNHAVNTVINYIVNSEGKLCSEKFPSKPMEDILEKGLEWSRANNSPELERDEADVRGWQKAMHYLTSAPVGDKVIQITGPGTVEGTMHQDNFVDIYEKVINPQSGQWTIRMLRLASNLTYPEYQQLALKKDPHYMDGFKGDIGAWLAGNVFCVNHSKDPRSVYQIFEQDFGFKEGIMDEERFQWGWTQLQAVARHYRWVLCHSDDPVEVTEALQALIVKNDLVFDDKYPAKTMKIGINHAAVSTDGYIGSTEQFGASEMFGQYSTQSSELQKEVDIRLEVAWLARRRAKSVGVACGVSSGFNISRHMGTANMDIDEADYLIDELGLSNSVGRYGISPHRVSGGGRSKGECPKITCKQCGWQPQDGDTTEYKACPECDWAPGKEVKKPK